MLICKELIGKTISNFTIYQEDSDGPEICIEFEDGTVFSSSLRTSTTLEAKVTQDTGGRPTVLKDYSPSPVTR